MRIRGWLLLLMLLAALVMSKTRKDRQYKPKVLGEQQADGAKATEVEPETHEDGASQGKPNDLGSELPVHVTMDDIPEIELPEGQMTENSPMTEASTTETTPETPQSPDSTSDESRAALEAQQQEAEEQKRREQAEAEQKAFEEQAVREAEQLRIAEAQRLEEEAKRAAAAEAAELAEKRRVAEQEAEMRRQVEKQKRLEEEKLKKAEAQRQKEAARKQQEEEKARKLAEAKAAKAAKEAAIKAEKEAQAAKKKAEQAKKDAAKKAAQEGAKSSKKDAKQDVAKGAADSKPTPEPVTATEATKDAVQPADPILKDDLAASDLDIPAPDAGYADIRQGRVEGAEEISISKDTVEPSRVSFDETVDNFNQLVANSVHLLFLSHPLIFSLIAALVLVRLAMGFFGWVITLFDDPITSDRVKRFLGRLVDELKQAKKDISERESAVRKLVGVSASQDSQTQSAGEEYTIDLKNLQKGLFGLADVLKLNADTVKKNLQNNN